MPKLFIFWARLLILPFVFSIVSPQHNYLHTDLDEMKFSDHLIGKRDTVAKYHPFLKNYKISKYMQMLINPHSRRKRAIRKRAGGVDDRSLEAQKFLTIIQQLSAKLKRDAAKKSALKTKKQRRNNDDHLKKLNPKRISKKDLINMLKSIMEESSGSTTEGYMSELSEIKKGLASISDIKRSIELLNSNIDALEKSTPSYNHITGLEAKLSLDASGTTEDFVKSLISDTNFDENRSLKSNKRADSIDHEIIQKIYDDVESLKKLKGNGPTEMHDFSCNVVGAWTSHVGGRVLQINRGSNNVLYINTTTSIPAREGFLNNPTWNLCGTNPFPNTGLILITGINESCRQVTTFIGECKFCEGKEVIQGQWLIGKLARDSADVIASLDLIGDVWKKEMLHEIRKRRLKIP